MKKQNPNSKKKATPPGVGRNLLTYGLIFLILIGVLQLVGAGNEPSTKTVNMSEIASEVKAGTVSAIEINGNLLQITKTDKTKLAGQREANQPLSQLLRDYGVTPEQLSAVAISVHQSSIMQKWLETALPFLLPLLVLGLLVWFMLRQ